MIRNLAFVLFFLVGHAMAETAAFDPKTNVLTVPSVQVDTKIYSTTQVALPADGKWAVVGIGAASAVPTADTAVFNTNTNVLTVPSLRVGPRLYSTTQLALPADGQWAAVSVGTVSAAPASNLVITPTSITGMKFDNVKLNIFGGTPPYVVSTSDYYVASAGSLYSSSQTYYSVSPAGTPPQAAATIIIGDKGSAQIWVTDAAGDILLASVTSTGPPTSVQNSCILAGTVDTLTQVTISPATITANTHEPLSLSIGGGKPPYLVTSSRSSVASVGPVSQSGVCQASVIISTLAAGTVVITATDAHGQQATTTITISDIQLNPFAVSPSTATVRAGAPINVSIVGGRPPYHVSSSYNFVAYPDKGTYESTTPNVEATIRTRSPGTATITVSDTDGKQAIVAVTVTQ